MRKEIKTVEGFLSAVRRLERNTTMCLKGYDDLTKQQQLSLGEMSASLGNILGDFNDMKK